MPALVYAEPFDRDEFAEYLQDAFNGGLEIRERSDRYRLLGSLTDELYEFRITDTADADKTITEIPASSKPLAETEEMRFRLCLLYTSPSPRDS